MEPEGSLLCSLTVPYLEPNESKTPPPLIKIHFNITLPYAPRICKLSDFWYSKQKSVFIFMYPKRATCLAHLYLLDLIIIIYSKNSTHCETIIMHFFLYRTANSAPLVSNIALSILIWNTQSGRGQASLTIQNSEQNYSSEYEDEDTKNFEMNDSTHFPNLICFQWFCI
jgi:hypothetical protein